MAQLPERDVLDLERSADLPVGVQLAWRLRVLIESGRLRPGDRLPGVRDLALGSGINVNTARSVYGRLEEEGLITSRHGLGTFVADGVEPSPALELVAAQAVDAAHAAGISPRDLARAIYAGSPDGPGGPPEESGWVEPGSGAGGHDETGLPDLDEESDERPARRDLRRQIARLERELAAYPAEAAAEVEPRHPLLRPKAHVAGIDELEATRDGLVERLKQARDAAERRGRRHEAARARLQEMAADPASHRWETLSSEDLGEPGCTTWEVSPRWGPVGALMSWWRIKVSGGCPLSGPREAAPAGPTTWSEPLPTGHSCPRNRSSSRWGT